MFFNISLYAALIIFALGMIYKLSTWFRYNISAESENIPAVRRVAAAIKGIIATLFSPKFFTLMKVFILDVLLQRRILQQDFTRWIMHMLIYTGFMLLLLMHALDRLITSNLFSDYYSTFNPYMFLRDFFGLMVIVGIGIAIYRRFFSKTPRLISTGMDKYAIIVVAVIMISGILLEGKKITSHKRFDDMVYEYGDPDDEQWLTALETYWVENYALVSPNQTPPFDEALLEEGMEANYSCVDCHSRPTWAFLGYATAKAIKPIAVPLDRANTNDILWYIHILACFFGLAYLPFSKMFHVFTTPISLMVNAVMDKETSDPANIATRQVMELDACMHCCTCTLNCSAAAYYEHFLNKNILPSEKIPSVKALASGKPLGEQDLKEILEGIYICTNCERCTVVCPAGINLQALWVNVRDTLLQKVSSESLLLTPFTFYRGLMRKDKDSEIYQVPLRNVRQALVEHCGMDRKKEDSLTVGDADRKFKDQLKLSDQADTFSACFGCETCTNVCPVVANYDNPGETLGLLPHQIMHTCALGIKELALCSNMLWDCLTCYQCQENCPQGVAVTDVLYELKNEAVKYKKTENEGQ